MKWCCPGFEGFYGNAGKAGPAILVGRDSTGRPEFTLQFRAVEQGMNITLSAEGPISSMVDVGMQYCLWCGRNLEKWYGNKVDALYRPTLKITQP